ncbi:PAP2 family protein [Elizabethkingia anophelis]|uniref:PAP2 superfamily protein n=3 Tax=Bacteria TaxID=2 RepID=A0A455ZDG0_9FLAO|nr:phosphatase PAP2 family protein [Elizabethkingia anophelis]AQW91579.1 phosphatidic acid phosphatase [Elizabethkingia anophelis]KUY18534.1 phosphatidic acid phosphatase [Elizabethkingia anophelis]MCT3897126.1 phosphatase PAP2 family protein [Elizabethkingia anophelis]MCT3961347.1 phosphatase PAP2 family protein [Elizabethkingia anophelis]MCT4210704.1 phosphatase PAP2 family protein [Elizabethkingia anophelis]
MKKVYLVAGIALFTLSSAQTDTIKSDTAVQAKPLICSSSHSIENNLKFFQKYWVKKSVAPGILFTASVATWSQKEQIREDRNRYLPNFKVPYDDYLQYAPAVTVYGLKLAGVKGRNNIGRASLSYATSLAIMAILVNSIKYTAKVERPDGSTRNSFPSGHSALAFTNAAFLDKEYGLVNPAYSIAGYSAATFTGLGRALNNRHWLPDILAGAGIGILSTELGYFFIDKIFKNKGDNMGLLSKIEGNGNPSFLALKSGASISISNLLNESGLSDRKTVGLEAGLEGAYFFSKNWGIGADFNISTFPIRGEHLKIDDTVITDIKTESLGFLNIMAGPYFAYNFSDKWQLMLKATAGYSKAANGKVFLKDNDPATSQTYYKIAIYRPSKSIIMGSGISLTYKITPQLGITMYNDIHFTNAIIKYYYNQPGSNIENLDSLSRENISYLTPGIKLTAFF